jgi:hypothetical protein
MKLLTMQLSLRTAWLASYLARYLVSYSLDIVSNLWDAYARDNTFVAMVKGICFM